MIAALIPAWLTLELVAGLVLLALILVYIVLYMTALPPHTKRLEGEERFLSPDSAAIPVPGINDAPTRDLSVVVPAYKETKRLPPMLDSTLEYLKTTKLTWEVIVVDDGSNDGTSEVALGYSKREGADKVRVLKLTKNRGKGGAVRMGMLSTRGAYLLMADADNATRFSDFASLHAKLKAIEVNGHGAAIGSRAHLEEESIATRSLFRTILMIGFHVLVSVCCGSVVKDTQCGFKLFTRKTGLTLFSSLHIDRWAFDVELLYVAQRLGVPIVEVAVNWQEIDGSKLDPLWSSIQMARDLVRIRAKYLLGLWTIDKTHF